MPSCAPATARLYFFVIVLFALGAEAGSLAVELLDLPAIWLSCLLLALSLASQRNTFSSSK